MKTLYSISKAAKFLGVSKETLRIWHKKGKLIPQITLGGQRRYKDDDIHRLMGGIPSEDKQEGLQ